MVDSSVPAAYPFIQLEQSIPGSVKGPRALPYCPLSPSELLQSEELLGLCCSNELMPSARLL